MTSYEETVANLKEAYMMLCVATEHNVSISPNKAFHCQCAIKDALSFMEEQKPKKRESRAMLPCKCGCKRRDHWYAPSSAWPEGLKCAKCGFTVWGDNATDVIRRWNEAVSTGAD